MPDDVEPDLRADVPGHQFVVAGEILTSHAVAPQGVRRASAASGQRRIQRRSAKPGEAPGRARRPA